MDVFQIIGEPRRREILQLIWDRELPVAEIAGRFDVTFGAISQHLAVLRDADIVSVRKDGNRRFYRANQDALGPFKQVLEAMWEGSLADLAQRIEGTQT